MNDDPYLCIDSPPTPKKKPRLFYYEEACDGYIPVPEKVEHMLEVESQFDDGETREILFKRVDMTDEEFDSLPED